MDKCNSVCLKYFGSGKSETELNLEWWLKTWSSTYHFKLSTYIFTTAKIGAASS